MGDSGCFSGVTSRKILPKCVVGYKKYTGYSGHNKGKYTASSFPALVGMPRGLIRSAVCAANNSLTAHTWSCYQSVKKHVRECQIKTGVRFSFPFSEKMATILVAYLLSLGTLKAATIESYLSAVRVWHLTRGHFVHGLRPDIVKSMLTGRGHEDDDIDRDDVGRMPVLIEHLQLLWELLPLDNSMSENERAAFWAISTLAFFGSFRLSELLPKKARQIDPRSELLRREVEFLERKVGSKKVKFLRVHLKSPKESRGNKQAVKVEVFATGNKFCPVEAFTAYVTGYGILQNNNAAFRRDWTGEAISQRWFGIKLKKFFKPYIKYGTLSGHSFRSGLSSLLGEAGFSDDEIMSLGRWSSSAFLNYIKLGRLARCRNAEKISNWLKTCGSM